MKVSVIIPSRLAPHPNGEPADLFLDAAVSAMKRQTVDLELEFVIGLDPGSLSQVPARFHEVDSRHPIRFTEATAPGQAQAVNAAVAASVGEVLVFAEDDDISDPRRLAQQLPGLDEFDFVSCNARKIDLAGNFVDYGYFPTGSSWAMYREIWHRVGPMDESFRFHVDSEWLGRANGLGIRRVHLVHDGAADRHGWMTKVARHSSIRAMSAGREPLLSRIINPAGGTATIERNAEARAVSSDEHRRMIAAFGESPW